VSNDSVKVQGTAQVNGNINTTGYVDLPNTKSIRYNGQNDWRLVETDYLENNAENWQYSPPTSGNQGAWSNSTLNSASVTTFSDAFAGKALVANYGEVFKKQFTLPQSTPYTYVKVVFNYYFIDSWDLGAQEMGWAAFSTTSNASNGLSVGWVYNTARIGFASGLNGLGFDAAADFGGNAAYSDQWVTGEMVARYPSTGSPNFWVMIGGTLDSAPPDEQFGVGKIEIWVK